MVKQYSFLILVFGIVLNRGYGNIKLVVNDSLMVILTISQRLVWSGKQTLKKKTAVLTCWISSNLRKPSAHLSFFMLLIQFRVLLGGAEYLRISKQRPQVPLLIFGHAPSEPQTCPLTTDKQMPNIYYPWKLPGLSSSGPPGLFKVVPLNSVSVAF